MCLSPMQIRKLSNALAQRSQGRVTLGRGVGSKWM